jgi:uncharacterized protein involved in exopolysaccharide biosynthesis
MTNFFKSSYIIKLVLNWKWHLLVIFILAVALSSIFSGPTFIKPKYKSYAVIYPSNIAPYSTETTTEQMLQLLKSEDILFDVVKKFKLYEEYKIDTSGKYYRAKIIKKLEDNITIKRTAYESVLIEVYDNSPIQACEMVNEILRLMNQKAQYLQRNKTAEIVKIYLDQLEFKRKQIDSIETRLNYLRTNYNILDYNIQVEEYSKGYVKKINLQRGGINDDISTTLNNLKQFGGEYRLLDASLWGLQEAYIELKREYDKSLSDLNKELTYANIVTKPIVPDKKAYPVRWLIVCITTISSILLSLILFSTIDSLKKSETTPQ